MRKTIVINIPITVSFDTEFDVAGKIFKTLLERELLTPELNKKLESVVDEARGRAQMQIETTSH